MPTKLALGLCALLGLSACGDTLADQAVVGAVAGAGTAIVLDGDAVTGAVLGAGGNVAFCQANPGRCRDGIPQL